MKGNRLSCCFVVFLFVYECVIITYKAWLIINFFNLLWFKMITTQLPIKTSKLCPLPKSQMNKYLKMMLFLCMEEAMDRDSSCALVPSCNWIYHDWRANKIMIVALNLKRKHSTTHVSILLLSKNFFLFFLFCFLTVSIGLKKLI